MFGAGVGMSLRFINLVRCFFPFFNVFSFGFFLEKIWGIKENFIRGVFRGEVKEQIPPRNFSCPPTQFEEHEDCVKLGFDKFSNFLGRDLEAGGVLRGPKHGLRRLI